MRLLCINQYVRIFTIAGYSLCTTTRLSWQLTPYTRWLILIASGSGAGALNSLNFSISGLIREPGDLDGRGLIL